MITVLVSLDLLSNELSDLLNPAFGPVTLTHDQQDHVRDAWHDLQHARYHLSHLVPPPVPEFVNSDEFDAWEPPFFDANEAT